MTLVEIRTALRKHIVDTIVSPKGDLWKRFFEAKPTDAQVDELTDDVLNYISTDDDKLIPELNDKNIDTALMAEIINEFSMEFQVDKKDPKDRPGGSNAGKYSKSEGPFCGPSGGAPAGTYPVGTRKRAKAALSYARNAPKPDGIKACVYRHYPDMKPGKGDSAEVVPPPAAAVAATDTKVVPATPPVVDNPWDGVTVDFKPSEKDPMLVDSFGQSELYDIVELLDLKSELPNPKAIPSTEERRKLHTEDFVGPNRTFLAATKDQVDNSLVQLEKTKHVFNDKVKAKIKDNLTCKSSLLAQKDPNSKGDPKVTADTAPAEAIGRVLSEKIVSLEKKLDNQTTAVSELRNEAERLRQQLKTEKMVNHNLQADRVVDLRLALGKEDVLSFKDAAERDKYRDQLATRTIESLNDTISDLRLELLPDSSPKKGGMDATKIVDESARKGSYGAATTVETNKDKAKRILNRK